MNADTIAEVLNGIYRECGAPNWDGYGAFPVIWDQGVLATFLCSLPDHIPVPSILAEPTGTITCVWENNAFRIMFSLDKDNRVSAFYTSVGAVPNISPIICRGDLIYFIEEKILK